VLCATQGGAGADTVLTDANGVATCNPIFGGVPNVTGTAYLAIGGYDPNDFLRPTSNCPAARVDSSCV
jgi:hypothetical protein